MTGSNGCNYKFENRQWCTRPNNDEGGYCLFHSQSPANNEEIKRFWWRLKRLALKGDGDWRGFNFPRIDLERITCPVFVTATRAIFQGINLTEVDFEKGVDISKSYMNGEVELQRCTFSEALSLKEVTFPYSFKFGTVVVKQGLIAENSTFKSDFKVSGTFHKIANFSQCHFGKKAEFLQTKTLTITSLTNITTSFVGSPTITLSVGGNLTVIEVLALYLRRLVSKAKSVSVKAASWLAESFRKFQKSTTQFLGNKFNHYRQRLPHKREGVKKYVLFDEKAVLDNMTFSEPKSVLFKGVYLRNATFGGTDLRGVTFIGNDWYQPKLKRNGLKDELRYFELNNYYDKKEWLPNIENTYRNIRFSLEEYKDFGLANDFFVGEMEARRKQLKWYKRWLFSVPAIYKLVSQYGTSPIRCGVFFIVAVIVHASIISYLTGTSIYSGMIVLLMSVCDFNINEIDQWFSVITDNVNSFFEKGRFMDSFTYSIQTMTLQREKVELLSPESLKKSSVWFVNAIFTLIGPVLVGLLALTVRARIKRN
jgi:uncharacterized protein YjbI with pentapeptide repeats